MDNLAHIEIRHSARAKRLSLRANAKKAVVELVVPPRTLQFSINRFLKRHHDWIAEKQAAFPQKTIITDGAQVMFQGDYKTLSITAHTKRTTSIHVLNDTIAITSPRADPAQNFKRWLIKQATDAITPLAQQKAGMIGKTISKIDMRDTSSRWGSCSSDSRLMFSWRLIMAPHYVLDYVVGHEVAHLQHMNHSNDFWELCYSLCERPDESRAWLNRHGNELLAIF